MMKKCLSWMLAALLLLAALPALSMAEETVSFTDSCGRTVDVPTEIARVAASGPAAQMVLFALAPDLLVALANPWSKEAEPFLGAYYSMPVIGQLYGTSDLNLEELAAVDPQVIVDVGEAKISIIEDMDGLQQQTGIPAVHIDGGIETYGDMFRILGSLLGLEERAEALAAYCDDVYARAQAIIETVGEDNKLDMAYLLGDAGLNAIAKGSYHSEVMDLLANNVVVIDNPSGKGTGNEIDMEQLMIWNPANVLFAPGSVYATVADDPLWQEIDAIQNGRYAEVPFGPYNWLGFPASVQRYLGLLWMCDLFYPEQAELDLYAEVATYYGLFYHHELSRDTFDTLMANATFR